MKSSSYNLKRTPSYSVALSEFGGFFRALEQLRPLLVVLTLFSAVKNSYNKPTV